METNAPSQQQAKTPKIRSVAYPSVSIHASVELAKKIDDEFTDVVFTPRENISKNLKLGGGALDRNLSSCVQYGLLVLKPKVGYKPSSLFKSIKRPLPTENVNDLYKQCLQHPELYKKLIIEFSNKQLPSISGLANILDRLYSVKGDAAEKAARVFINNLEALELIGADNTLSLEGGITPTEDVSENDDEGVDAPSQPPHVILPLPQSTANSSNSQQNRFIEAPKTKEIPIFFKDGREAKVILPIDFTDDEIRRVHKVIGGYLPD